MAVAVKSLGLPWVHSGVTCTSCHVAPITGYRYKCETCPNHELCEKCYRLGHTQKGHTFLRIARDSNNFHPPFQVYYIVCDDCGQAPIEGRRYHHRWRPNHNLCFGCFTKQPHRPGHDLSRDFEMIEDVKITTICATHSPVYHFHKCCGSCGVTPIIGPRFDSITYTDYSLCLVCFDTKFIKGAIKNEEYLRIERPETNKVRQIFVYSCMSCGDAPICGPAYVNQRVPEKVFCLLCYMNVPRQVQFEYSRVETPTQLGDPPAPAISQHAAVVTGGSIRSEDYTKLAREFELYRKEKEEKEEAAKLMAKKFVELNDKFVKQQTMGRTGDDELDRIRREKDEAVLECAKLSDDLERLKKEKEDDAEYATRIYVSRIEALEKEVAEGQDSENRSAEYIRTLKEENEKLKLDKQETMQSASVAREQKTLDADKEHLNLVHEFESLKKKMEEDAMLSAQKYDDLVKERMAENSNISTKSENEKGELLILISALESSKLVADEELKLKTAKYEELLREHLKLTDEFESLKEEKEAAENERDEHDLSIAILKEEVEKLKLEKQEAEGQATISRELATADAGKQELFKAEHLNLSEEFQKLKQMHSTLTTEYEHLLKEKEEEASLFAERYDNLAKEHLTLNEEFDAWKDEKTLAEREREEMHTNLTKEIGILREKGETGTVFAEKYANLEQSHILYKQEAEEEVRVIVEKLKDLEEEFARYKEDTEEKARKTGESEAEVQEENKKLKEDAAEWAALIEEFQTLVKVKETKILELNRRVNELEELLEETEAEARMRASEYHTLTEEYDALEKETDALQEKYGALEEDFEKFRQEKEELLKEKETVSSRSIEAHSSLAEEIRTLKEDLARAEETARLSRAENLELSEEFESFREEVEQDLAVSRGEHKRLQKEYENLKIEKGDEISDLIEHIEDLKKLLKEKEEASKTGAGSQSALLQEIENLKEDLENLAEEKKMEKDNAARLFHELQKDVGKLENVVKEKEESLKIFMNSSVNSIGRTGSVQFSSEDFNELKEENESLKEDLESAKEDFKKIFAKYQQLFQSRVTREEYERIKNTIPAPFRISKKGVGKCSVASICCYGVINEKKKNQLEEGYVKSRRNCKDPDLIRQSEEFMDSSIEELDRQFDFYVEEALTITDEAAQEFFETHKILDLIPSQ